MSETVGLCLRVDDVSYYTPAPLLDRLRAQVWAMRPVTTAVVPYMIAGTETRRIIGGGGAGPDFRDNGHLVDHLHQEVQQTRSAVAVHGLTHGDHAGDAGVLAEFECADPSAIDRLVVELKRFRRDYGTRFFAPPHNLVHGTVVDACVRERFDVCRSLSPAEVEALAGQASRRDEAKALTPFRRVGGQLEVFQTILLSKRRLARTGAVSDIVARRVARIAARSRIALVTVHWQDFVQTARDDLDTEFASWLSSFLMALEHENERSSLGTEYVSLNALAEGLSVRGPGAYTPSVVRRTGVTDV